MRVNRTRVHLEDEKKPEMDMDKGSQEDEKQNKFENYFKQKRITKCVKRGY